jgi:hypothetical protein
VADGDREAELNTYRRLIRLVGTQPGLGLDFLIGDR